MDLRVKRTQMNIRNAFLELRSKKPLEKITVKELAELACINKATFYQHYKDIYDLSESMEDEFIECILASIPHPDTLVEDPGRATQELFYAFSTQTHLVDILFSGDRRGMLVSKLESRVYDLILTKHPEYRQPQSRTSQPYAQENLEKEILITFLIQGSFHAYLKHSAKDKEAVVRIISEYTGRFRPS